MKTNIILKSSFTFKKGSTRKATAQVNVGGDADFSVLCCMEEHVTTPSSAYVYLVLCDQDQYIVDLMHLELEYEDIKIAFTKAVMNEENLK